MSEERGRLGSESPTLKTRSRTPFTLSSKTSRTQGRLTVLVVTSRTWGPNKEPFVGGGDETKSRK